MDKEHDGPRWLAGLGRADPLAKHPQGNVALPGPVFAAPDLAAFQGNGGRGLGGDRGGYAETKPANAKSFEQRASRQRISGVRHASSPRHVVAQMNSTSGRDGLKQVCAASQ